MGIYLRKFEADKLLAICLLDREEISKEGLFEVKAELELDFPIRFKTSEKSLVYALNHYYDGNFENRPEFFVRSYSQDKFYRGKDWNEQEIKERFFKTWHADDRKLMMDILRKAERYSDSTKSWKSPLEVSHQSIANP